MTKRYAVQQNSDGWYLSWIEVAEDHQMEDLHFSQPTFRGLLGEVFLVNGERVEQPPVHIWINSDTLAQYPFESEYTAFMGMGVKLKKRINEYERRLEDAKDVNYDFWQFYSGVSK